MYVALSYAHLRLPQFHKSTLFSTHIYLLLNTHTHTHHSATYCGYKIFAVSRSLDRKAQRFRFKCCTRNSPRERCRCRRSKQSHVHVHEVLPHNIYDWIISCTISRIISYFLPVCLPQLIKIIKNQLFGWNKRAPAYCAASKWIDWK